MDKEFIKELIKESKAKLSTNLLAILSFGSFYSKEFSAGISDFDLLFVIKKFESNTAEKLVSLRETFKEPCLEIDIKPITLSEVKTAEQGNFTARFLGGWGLEMIRTNHHKILYSAQDFSFVLSNSAPLSAGSLEGISRNVEKFRKLYLTNRLNIRGNYKSISTLERSKLAWSCLSTTIRLSLAYYEFFAPALKEALPLLNNLFKFKIKALQPIFLKKQTKIPLNNDEFDFVCNFIERLYSHILEAEKNKKNNKFIILIGGTAGVGKTTLAQTLSYYLGLDHHIGTGFIREVVRKEINRKQFPELFSYTFRPKEGTPYDNLFTQATILKKHIEACIDRGAREGTSIIVEGNHLIPGVIDNSKTDYFAILAVPSKQELKKRLQGTTHKKRIVTKSDVDAAWIIQRQLIKIAKQKNIPTLDAYKENCASKIIQILRKP